MYFQLQLTSLKDFVYYQLVKNEKIICQIVWVIEVYDQNGERVSKNDKSSYIALCKLKCALLKYEKNETLSMSVCEYL